MTYTDLILFTIFAALVVVTTIVIEILETK